MAASVGGVSCDLVSIDVIPLSERFVVWRVPGQDGFGLFKTGRGGSWFKATIKKFGTYAAVKTWKDAIYALENVISITDDWDETYSSLAIQRRYQPNEKIEAIKIPGTSTTARLVIIAVGYVVA